MENEELTAIQQQYEQLHSDVSELTKAMATMAEFLSKAEKEKNEEWEKQKKADEERKMFKRFVKALKEEGAVFARKSEIASIKTVTPEKAPEKQQAVIQGQAPENEEEEEEEKQAPEKEEKPEEEEEKQAPKEEEEDEKVKAAKAELETLQASIPGIVEKAVAAKMQEIGWKTVAKSPVKKAGSEEVVLLKGDEPMAREDLIEILKKKPLAELNDMHFRVRAGTLTMPEVK